MVISVETKGIINKLIDFLKWARWHIFFVVLSFSGIALINKVLEWIPSRDFVTIYPTLKVAIFSLIILIAIVLSYRQARLVIDKHPSVANFLLVVLTIIFTFSAYFIDKQNTFYNTNTFLVRVNGINIQIANGIIEDGFHLADFITEPYEENISFISKNFTSSECVTDYYSVMMQMRIANEINNEVRESFPWTDEGVDKFVLGYTSRKSDIDHYASTTIRLLEKLNKECHP